MHGKSINVLYVLYVGSIIVLYFIHKCDILNIKICLSQHILMSGPTDDQLRQAINGIFDKYDTDRSGTL